MAVNGTSSSVQIQLLFTHAVSKSKQRGLEDILGWFLCVRFFKCFRIGFQKGSDGRSILVCHLRQRWFNFIFQLPPESGIVIKPISSKFQASFQQIHACNAECLSPLTASHCERASRWPSQVSLKRVGISLGSSPHIAEPPELTNGLFFRALKDKTMLIIWGNFFLGVIPLEMNEKDFWVCGS